MCVWRMRGGGGGWRGYDIPLCTSFLIMKLKLHLKSAFDVRSKCCKN